MTSTAYLLREKTLVQMIETPWSLENDLQRVLATHTDLLAGDQMRPDEPLRWLLVTREAGIPDSIGGPDRWFVDHVFIDQDGMPTLVEVKRATNRQIRREVVGQMLEYAANALEHWPPERLRSSFERKHGPRSELLLRHLEVGAEAELDDKAVSERVESFWTSVIKRIEKRELRLVFVADELPIELVRIIEYLGQTLSGTEVLGVEVRQYKGDGHDVLVPRVVGQSFLRSQHAKPVGEAEQIHSEYWTQLAEYLKAQGIDPVPRTATQALTRVRYPIKGLRLRPWRLLDGRAGVSLEAERPAGEAIFTELRRDGSQLENALEDFHNSEHGERVRWGPEDHPYSYVSVDWRGKAKEPGTWGALNEWFKVVLEAMFGPVLEVVTRASEEAQTSGDAAT